MDFAIPADKKIKLKEIKKKDKYLDLARELKKKQQQKKTKQKKNKQTVGHESDGDINYNWCSWYSHQRIGKRTGGLGNKRTSRDHPNYYIIEIGRNTEKSPGDLGRRCH